MREAEKWEERSGSSEPSKFFKLSCCRMDSMVTSDILAKEFKIQHVRLTDTHPEASNSNLSNCRQMHLQIMSQKT